MKRLRNEKRENRRYEREGERGHKTWKGERGERYKRGKEEGESGRQRAGRKAGGMKRKIGGNMSVEGRENERKIEKKKHK